MTAPDAMLCERCGYDLAGLTRADNCPECGLPIEASLPGSHPGAPWQQRNYPRAVGATITALFADAPQAFRRSRTADEISHLTLGINTLVAAAIPALGVLGAMVLSGADEFELLDLGDALGYAAFVLTVIYFVLIMVWILSSVLFSLFAHHILRCRAPLDAAGYALNAWSCAWPLSGVLFAPVPLLAFLSPVLAFGAFVLGFLFLLVTGVAAAFGMRGLRYRNPPGAELHLRDGSTLTAADAPPRPVFPA